jgi:hypothetical protein
MKFNGVGGLRTHIEFMRIGDLCAMRISPAMGILTRQESRTRVSLSQVQRQITGAQSPTDTVSPAARGLRLRIGWD